MIAPIPANDSLPSWPRGMRREHAAAYLGISASKFDVERKAGRIPPAKPLFPGVIVWDRFDLDKLFDGRKPMVAANDNNEWDSVHEAA